jgi:hypothetical protein
MQTLRGTLNDQRVSNDLPHRLYSVVAVNIYVPMVCILSVLPSTVRAEA